MRYRLRTLLILLAIGPPMMAGVWPIIQDALWVTPEETYIFEPVRSGVQVIPYGDADDGIMTMTTTP